jgi:phosphopantothenoylcysteine decarboxylase/phosphopantothenate--cysteine ligase
VELVSGPVQIAPPLGANLCKVVSAADMLAACEARFANCDLFIAVAAVADFRPKNPAREKQNKSQQALTLELEPTLDIVRTLAARKTAQQRVVGFAAETHELEISALRKLKEKNLDWIVANDVSQPGVGMDADDNRVILFSRAGERAAFGPAPKIEVARFLLGKIVG